MNAIRNITRNVLIDLLLAEEIGWHIGDGSMNYYNGKGLYQLRGHIVDDKAHYSYRIKPVYKTIFDLDISLRPMPCSGVYGFQIWSNALVDYKSKMLDIPLGKKIDFGLPNFVGHDIERFRCFLRGYFDTDGCLYFENKNNKKYPRIEMGSVSGSFIKQILWLLKSLEFRASYHRERRNKHGWRDLHRIAIRGDRMLSKWFTEISPMNPKHVLKYLDYKKNGPDEI